MPCSCSCHVWRRPKAPEHSPAGTPVESGAQREGAEVVVARPLASLRLRVARAMEVPAPQRVPVAAAKKAQPRLSHNHAAPSPSCECGAACWPAIPRRPRALPPCSQPAIGTSHRIPAGGQKKGRYATTYCSHSHRPPRATCSFYPLRLPSAFSQQPSAF